MKDGHNFTQAVETHPQLERDIENLLALFGDDCMTYRSFESIDDIDIELKLPLDYFDVIYYVIMTCWLKYREFRNFSVFFSCVFKQGMFLLIIVNDLLSSFVFPYFIEM